MKIVKKVILVILILMLIVIGYIVIKGHTMYQKALEEKPLLETIKKIQEKEDYVKINEIPSMYKKAVIAVEDHRFYNHGGVDPISIGRAILKDLKAFSFVEGGSTLTQQLCKNIYFSQEKKLSRKVAEAFMAWEIEKNYEKDEILELYINTSYYGSGYYGIKQAANGYFNKEPKELNDNECTILAGIPNAPSVYSLDNSNGLVYERQKQVLDSMIELNVINELDANLILQVN